MTGHTVRALDTFADRALDRTVVLGYTRLGLDLRRRLPGWPADPEPGSLAGKDVVVTGASSGLGEATAEGLARLGATVHLVVRNLEKGERTRDALQAAVPSAHLELWRCDVSDLDDVRRFAGELAAARPALAGLVHNAGVMPPERSVSAQGHEMALAVHVLGPLAMTERLLAPLAAGDGRVVMVTSGGMYTQSLPFDDLEYQEGPYRPATAYARSKRVQVSLLPLLARRWGPRGVSVHATHPGWADTPGVVDSLPAFHRLTRPVLRDAAEGADTTVWLTAVRPAPEGGHLWHDRRVRPTHVLPWTRESDQQRYAVWRRVREASGLTEIDV
jgi:NAD(P)-dependent dehydrogenase (short-subunit alcohol dehydrogenase family)